MHEHELGFTALLNHYTGSEWTNYNAMLVLTVAFLLILPWLVRAGMSVAKPGYLQQVFELLFTFIKKQGEEVIGHNGGKYAYWFATCFVFILFANLQGVHGSTSYVTL